MTDNIVQQIARVIDPIAFKSWRESFEYNQCQGDDEETARRYADASYRRTCDEAVAKAEAILALPALIAKAERVDAMTDAMARIDALKPVPISDPHAGAQNGKMLLQAKGIARNSLSPKPEDAAS